MRPLVKSYGVISTRTLSPANTRMRFLRMRPAVWAMISCSFSSLTRKVALGSSSVTTPGNSSNSSFVIRRPALSVAAAVPAQKIGAEPSGIDGFPQQRCASQGYCQDSMDDLFVPARPPGKALLDAPHQHLAHIAIGVEPLLPAALGHRGVGSRPIFDLGRERPRQLEHLVVRLGRQRDDEVEVEALPLLQFLERHRLVAGDVDAGLVHGGDRERI